MKKSFSFQLIFSVALLVLVDLAYRFFPLDGFNHPWVPFENLGSWVNNKIEGVDKASIWATLNAIPTAAHTIWGVLCGKLLMSNRTAQQKIKAMVIAGAAGLVIGYSLDLLNVTPIIKKIATMSFVFASGGWAILALAFSYWLIDMKKLFAGGSKFFMIVGMNCIFIYLFFSAGGAGLLYEAIRPIPVSLFSWAGQLIPGVITSLLVWAAMWYMCFWLFRNKLYIKI